MKRHLKIVLACLYFGFVWIWHALAAVMHLGIPSRFIILYYHGVPASKRAKFARQMDALVRRTTVVGADWQGGEAEGHFCAVTFDDSLLSVLTNALPELAQRQLRCTIFVPSGVMGRVPDWKVETPLEMMEEVASAELVKSLPSSLVTIGAHTVSHPYLSRIDLDTARAEIEMSRHALSEVTGQDIKLMSFPYGDYSPAVVAICRESGYEFVFSIEPIPVEPAAKRFVRGRVAVEPDDGRLEFFLKVHGAYQWMALASRVKRTLSGTRAVPANRNRANSGPPVIGKITCDGKKHASEDQFNVPN